MWGLHEQLLGWPWKTAAKGNTPNGQSSGQCILSSTLVELAGENTEPQRSDEWPWAWKKTWKPPEGWVGQKATKILKGASYLNKKCIFYKIKILGNESTGCQGKKVAREKILHRCTCFRTKSQETDRIKLRGRASPYSQGL